MLRATIQIDSSGGLVQVAMVTPAAVQSGDQKQHQAERGQPELPAQAIQLEPAGQSPLHRRSIRTMAPMKRWKREPSRFMIIFEYMAEVSSKQMAARTFLPGPHFLLG